MITSKDKNLLLRKYGHAISSVTAGFLQDSTVASLICRLFCIGEELDASSYNLHSHEMFRA
jgi:hypothetical protein